MSESKDEKLKQSNEVLVKTTISQASGLTQAAFVTAQYPKAVEKFVAQLNTEKASNNHPTFLREQSAACSKLNSEHGTRALLLQKGLMKKNPKSE